MAQRTVKKLLKIQYLDGLYQGQTIQGRYKQGIGVYLWDNGCCYIGEWQSDQIDGEGVVFIPPSTFVHGRFIKDKLHGPVFIRTDEWVFEGHWVQGQPDGVIYSRKIDLSCESLKVYHHIMRVIHLKEVQKYININFSEKIFDQLSSVYSLFGRNPTQSEFTMGYKEGRDGVKYLGVLDSLNTPNGLGIKQHSDGLFDCGQFQEGLLQGSGRVQYPDGQIYQGGFHRDQYQNLGILIYRVTNTQGQSHIEYIRGQWAYGYISEVHDRSVLDDKKKLDRTQLTVKYTYQKGDTFEQVDLKTSFPIQQKMIKELEDMMNPSKLRQLSPEKLRQSSKDYQNSSVIKPQLSDNKLDQEKQFGYNQQKTLIYLNQIYTQKSKQSLENKINENFPFSNTLNSSKNNERLTVETSKNRKFSYSNSALTPQTKKQKYIKNYYQSLLDKNFHLKQKNSIHNQTDSELIQVGSKLNNPNENQSTNSQNGGNYIQLQPKNQAFQSQKSQIQKIREQIQKPYQFDEISPVKPTYKQPFQNKHISPQKPLKNKSKEKKKKKQINSPVKQSEVCSKNPAIQSKDRSQQQNIRVINPQNITQEYFTQETSKNKLNHHWKSQQGLGSKYQSQSIDKISITPRTQQISQSKVTSSESDIKKMPTRKQFQSDYQNDSQPLQITQDIVQESSRQEIQEHTQKQKIQITSSQPTISLQAKILEQKEIRKEIQTIATQSQVDQISIPIRQITKPETIQTIQDRELQFNIVSQESYPSQRETAFERQLRQEFEIQVGQKSGQETATKVQKDIQKQESQIQNKIQPSNKNEKSQQTQSSNRLQFPNLTPTVFQPKVMNSHLHEQPTEKFEQNKNPVFNQSRLILIPQKQKGNQQNNKILKPESIDEIADGNNFLSSVCSKNETISQVKIKPQPEFLGLSRLHESINHIKQLEELHAMDQLAWKCRSQSPHSLESEQAPKDTLDFMTDVKQQLKDQNEQIRSLAQVVKDVIITQKKGQFNAEQGKSQIEISQTMPFILPCTFSGSSEIIRGKFFCFHSLLQKSRIYVTPTVQPVINCYPFLTRPFVRSLSPRVTPQIYVQPSIRVSRTRLRSPREPLSKSVTYTRIIHKPQITFRNYAQLPQHQLYFRNI